jgi:hypothetical protein
MDAVLDLTARAASFIGVIQQLCVDYPEKCESAQTFHLLNPNSQIKELLLEQACTDPAFRNKAQQLLLISNRNPDQTRLAECLVKRELALLDWIWDKSNLVLLTDDQDQYDSLPSQERWRTKISRLLYERPEERATLASKIKYLPIQIVLASGGKSHGTLMQRLLQEYESDYEELQVILSEKHLRLLHEGKMFDLQLANRLLADRDQLQQILMQEEVPIPFELVLAEELKEIKACRIKRELELKLVKRATTSRAMQSRTIFNHFLPTEDPIETAKTMDIHSLAFSGGGIRSATFNLGVLQAFAKAGLLSRFDYLSTVSGGGYVGSWFVAWIKRAGSVHKISDRLNPDRSTDPMADEVRPIRWLRMYSNYLSPSTGIMSVDSWTVGMTITRNMLLNQILILLMLFTLLVFGRSLFYFWDQYVTQIPATAMVYSASAFILLGSLLAGAGMYFHAKLNSEEGVKHNINTLASHLRNSMLYLAYLAAFIASAWFFRNQYPINDKQAFLEKFFYLSPLGIVTFIGLISIAWLGRYDRCIPKSSTSKPLGIVMIGLFSFLAACAGLLFLASGWKLITLIGQYGQTLKLGTKNYSDEMAFTFGPPVILEVLAFTIVIRMALLGIYFPDDRREWWGRIGGVVHRIAFLWIIVAGATLLGLNMTTYLRELAPNLAVAAGGWAALVLGTVRAAFSSKSNEGESGYVPKALNLLATTGPYLFLGGLLVFLPILLNTALEQFFPDQQYHPGFLLILTVILGLCTFLLSWRIGVNEFSMHHFYKNRLVRAYLGATINRTQRRDSVSQFTGFNANDDLLLSALTNKNGYCGPYPLINTTLNASQVSELDRQDRQGESFVFSPLFCGFDFSKTRPSDSAAQKSYDYGYRPTKQFAYPSQGPHIGSAMAISGAAANPNQGSHSSAATAFLLTAFNVRLGWWIGNPRKSEWKSSNPTIGLPYLVGNLFGESNTREEYVCLSDGGHFENMGLYELVRRRSAVIVLGDAEQDDKFSCEGLANAIRRCRIDFGIEISIDVLPITDRKDHLSSKSYAIGTIRYPGDRPFIGTLIYIKSSITKDQPTDVREYAAKNPLFPHQSTGDQFFDETQFESYRKLGLSITEVALTDPKIKKIFFPQSNGNIKQHNTGSLVV